jgi:hypothetical protein
MEKHNGWSNYATWRINLEIFSSYELDEYEQGLDAYNLAEKLKDIVDEILSSEAGLDSLAYNYACAFIDDVNFYEIAQSLKHNEG